MIDVAQRQNKPINIEKLQAQRQMYSDTKLLMLSTLSIGVIIPIIVAFIAFILNNDSITNKLGIKKQDIGYITTFIGVSAAIFVEVSSHNVKIMKEKAAKIQEAFDTDVFNLRWDKVNVGEKVDYSIIYKKSKTFVKKNPSDTSFEDWYTLKAARFEYPKSIVLCQQQNLNWDSALRHKTVRVATFILIIITLLIVVLGLANDFKFRFLLTNVLSLLLPICLFFCKMIVEQRDTIEEMERLKDINNELIESVISDSLSSNDFIYRCRQLQTAIYHHRKLARPIPNWLHRINRQEQEDESDKRMQLYLDEHQ